jgi:hypothetical protein
MVPADDREAFDRDARALVESMAGPDGKVPCALDLLAVEAARGA